MKALIIGATGATGKDLLKVLLNDPYYTSVSAFVRRPMGLTHPKLKEIITDFEKPEEVSEEINGDILFSCLGTTLKDAGSKERQWKIDHDIPARFTSIGRSHGISIMVLLSAYGASTASRIFYSKMKGSLEEKIKEMNFATLIIFRPGLLVRKNTDRAGERISARVLRMMNSLGWMKKFRPLPTEVLAEKMALAPKAFPSGTHFISLDSIFYVQ
ncbi:MAG: NAD(P)H-binding protein [Chitinophagaceae bacterium]|nr:NAD(P)H-binding protein [Chitinophagaceae bacterium]